MSDIAIEEIPTCHLREAWSVVNRLTGELHHVDGAALVWLYEREAEFAAEQLGANFSAIRIRVGE